MMLFCSNPHPDPNDPDDKYSCNDPWHFGTLHESMLTLFRVCTFEDWTDVMYINVYGCNECRDVQREDYPVYDGKFRWATMNWLAALYFLIFTILSAMVLLTLFIGVICTSMEEAAELGKTKRKQEAEMLAWCKEKDVPMMAVRAWRKVFAILDVDESGTLDEDMIRVGFSAGSFASVNASSTRAMPAILKKFGDDNG